MTDLLYVGKNIKTLREQFGLTQRELADHVQVSFQAISAWERGLYLPELDNIIALSNFFGVTVDSMLVNSEADLYVGIDGGGTKTEFVLFSADGTVEKVVKTAGSNPNDHGIEACVDTIVVGLERLLNGRIPTAIFGGIAGSSSEQFRKKIAEGVQERIHAKITVDSDMENILCCATDPNNAYALISGTGSCMFVRKNGVRYRLGGWGYLLDQAGSAYDVGKDALRCLFAAEDGMQDKTPMTRSLAEALGGDVYGAIPEIYRKGRSYIADLSRFVVDAAENGEEDALKILWENAEHLARIIKTASQRFGKPEELLVSGGFIGNDLFRGLVEERAETCLTVSSEPPVYGACVRCLMLEDVPISDDFRKKFMDTYRRVLC